MHLLPQKRMMAQVIREDRMGEPECAFSPEEVDVPALERDEVLVKVMAAGINHNGVFAALGQPVNVIAMRRRTGDSIPFHIAGSDASGVIAAVGEDVTQVRVGEHVVLHCAVWNPSCPIVRSGQDPCFSDTFRIWGYETNWGSFAQFAKVKWFQCMPKAEHLSWEEAAVTTLVGATGYRMLTAWPPHQVTKGDIVLIWGGAGGLGSMAIQIVNHLGGIPVAVSSGKSRVDYCLSIGAAACIDRTEYTHWGPIPDENDKKAYAAWHESLVAFGKAIHKAVGERRNPRIVFEHPGQDTMPTSVFVCATGGMIVTCGATTGFLSDVDLRYVWMRQKRLQGSHFANREQADAFNDLVREGKINPCLTATHDFSQIPLVHQMLKGSDAPVGRVAIALSNVNY